MSSPDPPGNARATLLIAGGGAGLCLWALLVPAHAPALAVGLALLAVLLALRLLYDGARVRQLRRVAEAYAEGDLSRRCATPGSDAIAWLGSDLNGLGERLVAAQGALERQRRLLDSAIASLAEGVACIDHLDRVLYANPAWRHLAAGGEIATGSPYYRHLPAAALAGAIANVRVLAAPETVEFEHRRRLLRATATLIDEGAVVLVLHDLTELRRLEGARRDFVASVSHELKTPLTAIAGFAETLLDGALADDPAAARGFVEKIARHADRLTVLVRDVLTLSRLEQGAWQVRPEQVAIPELVRQLCEEQQPAAAARDVRLAAEGPDGLVAATDAELLRQLLGNLLGNAIRYNRPGGSATVAWHAADGRLHLSVADTGIGIPAEARERIFQRFYRIDAHRSRASGGTGLGLAIVKQIVDTLQGAIAFDSSEAGTVFRVDLPLADPRAARG